MIGSHEITNLFERGIEMTNVKALINDGQKLVGATYRDARYRISTYDDGCGPLWISRNSIGINGIVRAQNWSDAYEICEDEFFPGADETIEELQREYGYREEHFKVVRDDTVTTATEHTGVGERFAMPEDYIGGKLNPTLTFLRWESVRTEDPGALFENLAFNEGYGFRPNGPNRDDTQSHGIYSKDLNGDSLDLLTPELVEHIGIDLQIEGWESEEVAE